MNPFDRLNKRLLAHKGLTEPFVLRRQNRIIRGVYDRDYVDTNDINGYAPVITCNTDDATDLVRGDIIERDSELFSFIFEEPDGTGVSRLILESYAQS